VNTKDNFYNRHITKNHLFDPIFEIFKIHSQKYNLINSALLELFEFIRKENIRALVSHLVENYRDEFKDVTYVDTFKNLIIRHEQNSEVRSTTPIIPSPSDSRTDLEDEQDYFRESDDEDQANNGSSTSGDSNRPPLPMSPMMNGNEDIKGPPKRKEKDDDDEMVPTLAKKRAKISINIKPMIGISDENRTKDETMEESSSADTTPSNRTDDSVDSQGNSHSKSENGALKEINK